MKKRHCYNLFLLTLILCFGVPGMVSLSSAITKPEPVPPMAIEDAPVNVVPMATQGVGLRLVGTVVADNPDHSLAIIEIRTSKKQYLRREGDRVGKALVKRILRNQVIIDAGKGEERLTMLHGQPSASPPVRYQAATSRPSVNTLPSEKTLMPTRLNLKEVEPYFADMDAFKQRLQLHPITEANDPIGFLLRKVRRGGILWRMGLRNRDVIMGVNGTPITSPAEADLLFRTLKQGGEISIEIERRNQPQELLLAIQ